MIISNEEEVGRIVSNQLRSMFITYTMAINKQEGRTGGLLERSFKRLVISTDEYLKYVIFYTHYNPEKHGFIFDYKIYKYSSFQTIKFEQSTFLSSEAIIEIYGSKLDFLNNHSFVHGEKADLHLE
jgi:hypothetical protein